MDPSGIRKFRRSLLHWYDQHGRILPWRQSDPYRVWISEIMLQQTTVTAVIPYFERFISRFPDLATLAAAPLDDVLRLWEGLGYYSRARNLHRAAISVVQNSGGQLPPDPDELQKLPGIGRYTAGAISSFAFGRPAPIVEANTERLYARLLGLQDDVRSSPSQKLLWEFAGRLVPRQRPGDFNQALMDLGAQLCRPQDPACPDCPVAQFCLAAQNSLQNMIPVRKPRAAVTEVTELATVLMEHEQVLLRRRTASERWAGMWDFPRMELSAEVAAQFSPMPGRPKQTSVARTGRRQGALFPESRDTIPVPCSEQIEAQTGCELRNILDSMELTYQVTRFRVRLLCVLCRTNTASSSRSPDLLWTPVQNLREMPLSKSGRRIADWVLSHPRFAE